MVISIKKYVFNPFYRGVSYPLYRVFHLPSTEGLRSFSKEYGNPEKNVTFYSVPSFNFICAFFTNFAVSRFGMSPYAWACPIIIAIPIHKYFLLSQCFTPKDLGPS